MEKGLASTSGFTETIVHAGPLWAHAPSCEQ